MVSKSRVCIRFPRTSNLKFEIFTNYKLQKPYTNNCTANSAINQSSLVPRSCWSFLLVQGPSAVVVVGGNIHVLVMSRATYDWADEQYLLMGLDPAAAKFIGTCMHTTTVLPVGPCSEIRKVYWIMYVHNV